MLHSLAMNLLGSARELRSRLNHPFRTQFFFILIAGLTALLPVILFVHLYIDDYSRSFSGHFGWDVVGRPLADIVFYVVNYGHPSVAVSPLYTLLSVFIYSLSGLLMVRAYGHRTPLWSALAVLPLFVQPYGLENLSYGFDSVFMSLSVALAIVAAILVQMSATGLSLVGGFLLLEASLCMYQPGTSGFIPVAGFLIIGSQLSLLVGDLAVMSLQRRLLRSLVAYGAALLGYRALVSMTYEQWSGYGMQSSQIKSLPEIFSSGFATRLMTPWDQIATDFVHGPLVIVLTCFLACYVLLVFRRVGLRHGFCLLGFAVIVGFISPGPLLLLKESMFHVPRMMLFLGPLLVSCCSQLLALLCLESRQNKGYLVFFLKIVSQASVVSFAWFLLVFSYAYGQSFEAQSDFEQQRISRLVSGVSELQAVDPGAEFRYALVEGVMPASPLLANTIRKFPLIDRLVPRLVQNDWSHGLRQIAFYGLAFERLTHGEVDLTSLPNCNSLNAYCRSEYQLFRLNMDTLVIKILPIRNPLKHE